MLNFKDLAGRTAGSSPAGGWSWWTASLAASSGASLQLLVLCAIAMLVVPLPPLAIDAMVSLNLFFGTFLVLATISASSILSLTTFPSLLLLTTVFRLAVSVSTTRAVLTTGDAGSVIKTFGEFVVGDNLVVGLVVFLVIAVVQFLVITKGGERTAEISARFTLDAMPGKQMSIDADLRAGDIDKTVARARRHRLEQESQFFGAMDGAMKFVKGDCIASLLIVVVNLLGGLLIGTLMHGMPASAAVEKYLILSIGDGLVAQIPSILSTIAAGVLTTRITTGDEVNGMGADLVEQIGRERRSLATAASALALLGFVPGFPTALLLGLAGMIGATVFLSRKPTKTGDAVEPAMSKPLPVAAFGDVTIAVVHPDDFAALDDGEFAGLIEAEQAQLANELGYGQVVLKFKSDRACQPGGILLKTEGVTRETVSLAAFPDRAALARHLARASARLASIVFGVDEASEWLDVHGRYAPRLVENVQQHLPIQTLAEVLKQLIAEDVSIAHSRVMLTALVASISYRFEFAELLEDARLSLATQIVAANSDPDGRLVMVTLDGASTESFRTILSEPDNLSDFDTRQLERAEAANELYASLLRHRESHPRCVLAVPKDIRLELWKALNHGGQAATVLSFNETRSAKSLVRVGPVSITFATMHDDEEVVS